MNMLTVREVALKWAISEQMVRYHCRAGNIPGAYQSGKEWLIPEDAPKPERKEPVSESPIPQLAKKLKNQKNGRNYHGLYDYVQTNLTYSSCRMASNRLTRDQVDMIWKKGKVVSQFEPVKVSDCIETLNHRVCVDYIIDHAMEPITQKFIKKLHFLLMTGSVDERLKKVVPGEFRPNEYKVTGRELPPACTIPGTLREIINEYEEIPDTELGDILNFHVEFEMIAPFQDGNGRIGRLIMFKECLRHDISKPFDTYEKIEGLEQAEATRLWYRNGGKVTHEYWKHIRKDTREEIIQYLHSLYLNLDIEVNGKTYKLVHASPIEEYEEFKDFYNDPTHFAVWKRWRRFDRFHGD